MKSLAITTNSDTHTMESALYNYLKIKIHPLILDFKGHIIIVRGSYERSFSQVSIEKTGKIFNFKRPTAELSQDNQVLYLNCFPGIDYVYHYANVIGSYLALNDRPDIKVIAKIPSTMDVINSLLKTNIMEIPKADIVILGTIEKMTKFAPSMKWQGNGDFGWIIGTVNNKKIALLGCKFSFWGDIAGHLVHILAQKGVKTVLYTGKLGGLKSHMQANRNLATGSECMLNGEKIVWENILCIPENPSVIHGVNFTLPSVLNETKTWFLNIGYAYSFVESEIGYMAEAANKNQIHFSYIHLISDNVAKVQVEHLGNERDDSVINKRQISSLLTLEILYYTLLMRSGLSYMNLRFFKSIMHQLKTEHAIMSNTIPNSKQSKSLELNRYHLFNSNLENVNSHPHEYTEDPLEVINNRVKL